MVHDTKFHWLNVFLHDNVVGFPPPPYGGKEVKLVLNKTNEKNMVHDFFFFKLIKEF